MQKAQALRESIVAIIPELARDPDRLHIWIDKGRVRTFLTASRNFAWEYVLSVHVENYTGHPAVLVHAINQWVRINQPDLCKPGEATGYTFEAEIIDASTLDLLFELSLTEDALVTPAEGGGWTIEHPGEPDPMFDDDAPLAAGTPLLTGGWANPGD